MRRKRFSVAQLMAAIALAATVLAFLRHPDFWLPPGVRRDRVAYDLSSGERALMAGHVATAHRHFENAVRLDPESYDGLSLLARTDVLQGNYVQAYRRIGQAINVSRKAEIKGLTVPSLLSHRAWLSIQLSRRSRQSSEAAQYCRHALDDLVAATMAGAGQFSMTKFQIERVAAEVEQRLGEIEFENGNPGAAEAHYLAARSHALSAIALRKGDRQACELLFNIEKVLK